MYIGVGSGAWWGWVGRGGWRWCGVIVGMTLGDDVVVGVGVNVGVVV